VGHEQDPAPAPVHDCLQMLPACKRILNAGRILKTQVIEKNPGEILELAPGAPELMGPRFPGKKPFVKVQTDSHAMGAENEIPGRNAPGNQTEKPGAADAGEGCQAFVKRRFHSILIFVFPATSAV